MIHVKKLFATLGILGIKVENKMDGLPSRRGSISVSLDLKSVTHVITL